MSNTTELQVLCDCSCCHSGYYFTSNEDYTDYLTSRYEIRVDFYTHLESVLTNRTAVFDDEILNVQLDKIQVEPSNERRVLKLLDLIKSKTNTNNQQKLVICKSLLCWQSQFSDLSLLVRVGQLLGQEIGLDRIGDYEIESKAVNSLYYSIRSGSEAILRQMIENYGTRIVYRRSDGQIMNPFSCAILNGHFNLLDYLMKCYKSTDPDSIPGLLEDSIETALAQVSLEALRPMLEFALGNSVPISSVKLASICKLISYKLDSTERKLDLKLFLFKLIFERFSLSVDESLFSSCFEFTEPEMYTLLLRTLRKTSQAKQEQEILIDTFMSKMKRSFECNIKLIEILLQHIDNKRLLYRKLVSYEKGRLIRPGENQLKSIKLPGYGLNSYFIKQQLLVKYDVIPVAKRTYWIASYIYHWVTMCSQRRTGGYVSASSIVRFATIDEIIELVGSYLKYLLDNGLASRSSVKWWLDLKQKRRRRMSLMGWQDRTRLESCILGVYESRRRTPLSLKMLARNRVRYLLYSLSDRHLASLQLPTHLIHYVKLDS